MFIPTKENEPKQPFKQPCLRENGLLNFRGAPKGTRNADIAHKEHQRVARERRTESSWKPLKQRYVTLTLQLLSGKRIAQKEMASESLCVDGAERSSTLA